MAASHFVGEYELIAVATLQLALVQTSAVVCIDAVAVCHEEDHLAGLIGVDLLELLPEVADLLVALGAPVALQVLYQGTAVVWTQQGKNEISELNDVCGQRSSTKRPIIMEILQMWVNAVTIYDTVVTIPVAPY